MLDTNRLIQLNDNLKFDIAYEKTRLPSKKYVINTLTDTPIGIVGKSFNTTSHMNFIDGVENVIKENRTSHELENAKVTTCDAGQNEWFITSDETIIDQSSGNIKAKHATLSLKGVPIMYSPYVDFSTTSQRKSGWLLPTAGSTTTSGFETSIPYYFNLSPTHDATLTSRYMEKRGLQFDGEFRYKKENFEGTSQIQYLNKDKESDIDNRYLLNINHKHNFGHGFSGTIEYEKVKNMDVHPCSPSVAFFSWKETWPIFSRKFHRA